MAASGVSAATRFASIPELVGLLAEQIQNHARLANLRLTSRTFASAVAPYLFADIRIGQIGGAAALRGLSACEHVLRHVRRLRIKHDRDFDEFNDITEQMLRRMPLLESFSWQGMLLAKETLAALHEACPRLTALRVEFPEKFVIHGPEASEEDDDGPGPEVLVTPERYEWPDFTVFSGLRELAVLYFNRDVAWWRPQIVRALQNNRASLRDLALSDAWDGGDSDGFFERLCTDYGATGSAPLRLESMQLGYALYYRFQRSSLELLTDLRHLRDVNIANIRDHNEAAEIPVLEELRSLGTTAEGAPIRIAFCAFGPTHCPNLRRFTIADYWPGVQALFAAASRIDAAWACQVALLGENAAFYYEPAGLLRGGLPGVRDWAVGLAGPLRLRMLEVNLQRGTVFLLSEKRYVQRADMVRTAAQVLADLARDDDGGALEGLAVVLPTTRGWTEFMDVDLLAGALARLSGLTQLVLPAKKHLRMELLRETTASTARQLAAGVPSLRYVKVVHAAWRILRGGGEAGAVQLEELDGREMEGVELFRLMERNTNRDYA